MVREYLLPGPTHPCNLHSFKLPGRSIQAMGTWTRIKFRFAAFNHRESKGSIPSTSDRDITVDAIRIANSRIKVQAPDLRNLLPVRRHPDFSIRWSLGLGSLCNYLPGKSSIRMPCDLDVGVWPAFPPQHDQVIELSTFLSSDALGTNGLIRLSTVPCEDHTARAMVRRLDSLRENSQRFKALD